MVNPAAWVPREEVQHDSITAGPLHRLAATLDYDGVPWCVGTVPPLGRIDPPVLVPTSTDQPTAEEWAWWNQEAEGPEIERNPISKPGSSFIPPRIDDTFLIGQTEV